MDEEKLLPDLEYSGVKNKKMQKVLSDTSAEPVDDNDGKEISQRDTDSDNQSDTDSDSDSDSEYECRVCQRKISGYIAFKQHQKGKKHAKAVLKKKKEREILEKDANSGSEEGDEEHLIEEPYAVCKACDKQFPGPESYQKHLISKTHKRKLLEASILEQVKEKGEINVDKLKELIKSKRMPSDVAETIKEEMSIPKLEDDDEAVLKEFECKECEKEFSGLKPFAEHLLSKSHMKKVQKKKLLNKVVPGESNDDKTTKEGKERDISTLSVEDDVLVCKLCTASFSGPENAMQHLRSKKHSKVLDKYIRKLEKKKKKNLELRSDERAKDGPTENQITDRETNQEHQLTTNLSRKLEIPDNSENQEFSASGGKDNEFISYDNYKKYKGLMDSLPKGDRIVE